MLSLAGYEVIIDLFQKLKCHGVAFYVSIAKIQNFEMRFKNDLRTTKRRVFLLRSNVKFH